MFFQIKKLHLFPAINRQPIPLFCPGNEGLGCFQMKLLAFCMLLSVRLAFVLMVSLLRFIHSLSNKVYCYEFQQQVFCPPPRLIIWKFAFLFLTVLTVSIPTSQGQSESFLTETTLTDEELSSIQLENKGAITDLVQTESFQFIIVGDLPQIQHDGILSLQIPGDTSTYTFIAETVISDSLGNYSWVGTLLSPIPCVEDSTSGPDCISGSLLVLKEGNSISGIMRIDDSDLHIYEIKDLGEGLNAWVKIGLDSISGDDCAILPRGGETFDTTEVDISSHCPVKVLAFYTEAAAAAYPDVLLTMKKCVLDMNYSLNNSHISEQLLKIELVGTISISSSSFSESGGSDIDLDVMSLITNSYVTTKKADYNADIVVVFTDDSYNDRGIVAAFGDGFDDKDSAYAIVTTGAALVYHTFAHEMGHLFGARHEIIASGDGNCASAGTSSSDGLPHSHGWIIIKGWNNRAWKTIMAICNQTGIPRISHYSNPNVEFKNRATGTTSTNFNAKTIAEAACRVSRYVTTEEPIVYIIGPNKACPGDEAAVEGVVSGVSAPIQYYWQYSYDGFNYLPPNPTSSSKYFQATMPSNEGESVYFKLTAGTSGGPYVTTIPPKRILAEDQEFPPCNPHRPVSVFSTSASGPVLSLFPNPAQDEINLQIKDADTLPFDIAIFDVFGRAVKNLTGRTSSRFEEIPINISSLANGMYWLAFRSRETNYTVQFTRLTGN